MLRYSSRVTSSLGGPGIHGPFSESQCNSLRQQQISQAGIGSQDVWCECSSGGSSGGSFYGGGYSGPDAWKYQIMGNVLQIMMQRMMENLLAPQSNSSNIAEQQKAQKEAEEKRLKMEAEYKERIKKHIEEFENEFKRKEQEEFSRKNKTLADKFASRYASKTGKEEKADEIKQLNCAAYTSIESAKISRSQVGNLLSMRALNTPMETIRSGSDFTTNQTSSCPKVDVKIAEPGMPESSNFQEGLYEFVIHEANILNTLFKGMQAKIQSADNTISVLQTSVKRLKEQPNQTPESNKELLEAQLLLNDAFNERDTIINGIKKDVKELDKKLSVLSTMRQQYDVPKSGEQKVKEKKQP